MPAHKHFPSRCKLHPLTLNNSKPPAKSPQSNHSQLKLDAQITSLFVCTSRDNNTHFSAMFWYELTLCRKFDKPKNGWPCSADNENVVCDYVSRLARLQDEVKEKLILIPRIYTNKPRTTGEGYKGMAHQPVPSEAPNMVEGLRAV